MVSSGGALSALGSAVFSFGGDETLIETTLSNNRVEVDTLTSGFDAEVGGALAVVAGDIRILDSPISNNTVTAMVSGIGAPVDVDGAVFLPAGVAAFTSSGAYSSTSASRYC